MRRRVQSTVREWGQRSTPKRRILSMGAGVQTTAMLLMYYERYDAVIFADTGNEQDETYEYIGRYLIPFCEQHGLPWITVYHLHGRTVLENAARSTAPELYFKQRQCTDKNKIQPVLRYIRTMKPKPTADNPIIEDIGFSSDEYKRLGQNPRDDDPKYIRKEFPLYDNKISRQDCKDIIRKHKWPIPPSSHCKMCPLVGVKRIRSLFNLHPKEFDALIDIEKSDRKYPDRTIIKNHPLEKIVRSHSLLEFSEQDILGETCDNGGCHT